MKSLTVVLFGIAACGVMLFGANGCAYYPSASNPQINAGKPPVGQYYLTPPPVQPENYFRFKK